VTVYEGVPVTRSSDKSEIDALLARPDSKAGEVASALTALRKEYAAVMGALPSYDQRQYDLVSTEIPGGVLNGGVERPRGQVGRIASEGQAEGKVHLFDEGYGVGHGHHSGQPSGPNIDSGNRYDPFTADEYAGVGPVKSVQP
jgi:hypothetical protein